MRICPSCNQLEESDHDQKACEIDRLRAEVERLRAANKQVSDAYLRIREMLGAWDTPTAPTPEQVYAHTEQKLERLRGERENEYVRGFLGGATWADAHPAVPGTGGPSAINEARRRLAEEKK